jgi:hypothetical protein
MRERLLGNESLTVCTMGLCASAPSRVHARRTDPPPRFGGQRAAAARDQGLQAHHALSSLCPYRTMIDRGRPLRLCAGRRG